MPFRNKATPFIAGICGGSGSGKTFLLDQLRTRIGEGICLLSQDHYYFPLERQQTDANGEVNFDLPSAIDQQRFIGDLDRLSGGQEIQLTEYTFNNPDRAARSLQLKPAPVILVEGLFIFHLAAIRERLNFKVFVETDDDTALARRIKRDLHERAYSEDMVRYQWKNHVQPAYRDFLLPYRGSADLIIHNPPDHPPDLTKLIELILVQRSIAGVRYSK